MTQADEHLLAALPLATKQALLASLRRRLSAAGSTACCRCVGALVDVRYELLDLSGLPLSDSCLSDLAPRISRVRSLDLRRCTGVTRHGLRALLAAAHSLELFRCGGCAQSDAAALAAVACLLPSRLAGEDEESWEVSTKWEVSSGLPCCASKLRWLVWPEAPPRVRALLQRRCPRIRLLPEPQDSCMSDCFASRPPGDTPPGTPVVLPYGSNVAHPLDAVILAALAPLVRDDTSPSSLNASFSHAAEPVIHIAELFRLAYVAREERLLPKRAKNARQRRNRELRRASASMHCARELELRAEDA